MSQSQLPYIHLKKCYFENLRCPSCIMTNAAQICRYHGMPWVNFGQRSYQNDYDDVYEGLSAELEDFYQFIRPKPEDDALRKATFLCIAKSIKKSVKFDIENVKYYGSFSSNTYLPVSDIDMVVTVKKETNVVAVLFEVAYLLFYDGIIEKHCTIIPHSRIPLLKFYDCVTGFQINITINTPNVMERAEYIRHSFFPKGAKAFKTTQSHVNGQYELKILYFMKYYLLYRGSNQVYFGGIGSYALSLMVLRYFQEKETVDMINRATYTERNSSSKTGNDSGCSQSSLLGRLLIGFLQRYSDVDFISKVIISVREGGAYIATSPVVASQVPQTHSLNISDSSIYSNDGSGGNTSAPAELHTQMPQASMAGASGRSGGMKQPPSHFAGHYLNKKCSILRIEDPREPWKNVSAGSFNSDLILADFGRLLQVLLNPRTAGSLHRLYDDNQNQWSIIANGLTVVDSFVEYRAILKDIYSYWFPLQQAQQSHSSHPPSPRPTNEHYENFVLQRNIFGKRHIEFEYKRFEDNTAQLVLLNAVVPGVAVPPPHHNLHHNHHHNQHFHHHSQQQAHGHGHHNHHNIRNNHRNGYCGGGHNVSGASNGGGGNGGHGGRSSTHSDRKTRELKKILKIDFN